MDRFIPKGKKVALVGASGSGKSAMEKLLMKYYEPENSEITVDGVDINEFMNLLIRKAIAYVPQTIELFSKSIYDNIRVSKMRTSLEAVKEAAKVADAHAFIKKLPLQYYTFLEEAGNGLSGGEKQRIAPARAFLKNNGFYILDESTSNLDLTTGNIFGYILILLSIKNRGVDMKLMKIVYYVNIIILIIQTIIIYIYNKDLLLLLIMILALIAQVISVNAVEKNRSKTNETES